MRIGVLRECASAENISLHIQSRNKSVQSPSIRCGKQCCHVGRFYTKSCGFGMKMGALMGVWMFKTLQSGNPAREKSWDTDYIQTSVSAMTLTNAIMFWTVGP